METPLPPLGTDDDDDDSVFVHTAVSIAAFTIDALRFCAELPRMGLTRSCSLDVSNAVFTRFDGCSTIERVPGWGERDNCCSTRARCHSSRHARQKLCGDTVAAGLWSLDGCSVGFISIKTHSFLYFIHFPFSFFFTSELPSAGSSSSLPIAPVRHKQRILLFCELTDVLGVFSGGCRLVSTQGVVTDLWSFGIRREKEIFFLREAETSSGRTL